MKEPMNSENNSEREPNLSNLFVIDTVLSCSFFAGNHSLSFHAKRIMASIKICMQTYANSSTQLKLLSVSNT